jgi:pre-rRNA-processing protein TSR1
MVIDEQGQADEGSDGSDIDAVSHFTEKFDAETAGDTEMAVSFFVFN